MAEALFSDHEKYLSKKNELPNIIFLYGDPYLVDIAREKAVSSILPGENTDFSVEKYDGTIKNVNEILDIVFTFSFFSDNKVVVYNNPPFFEKNIDYEKIAARSKKDYEENRSDLSASSFLRLGNAINSKEELYSDKWKNEIISKFFSLEKNTSWIDSIVELAAEKKMTAAGSDEENDLFLKALDKEFPSGNYLIITGNKTDKKRKIYKKLKEKALVVDCSLPMGARKKDKEQREAIARDLISRELVKSGKKLTINSDAVFLLLDYSGDDLRTVSKNLNQVITYSSEKKVIGSEDIKKILERTREDPVFSFTGAVAEGKKEESLFYMYSLISGGYHPLQIFAALFNQINRMYLARDFIASRFSQNWNRNINYNIFTKLVVPEINAYDENISSLTDTFLEKGRKLKSDYLLLGKGKNYYPLFLLLKNASLFEKSHLEKALILLGECDYLIKTGADPVKSLENFLFRFFSYKGFD